MFKLSQKLSLGFGGLLLILIALGVRSILLLSNLGSSIDVILRENYRSVVACQDMKEALERMDSGLLFILLGEDRRGGELIRANERAFAEALQAEMDNITLIEEGPKARDLKNLFGLYRADVDNILAAGGASGQARAVYFERILPLFQKIKESADGILRMNQGNMNERNDWARRSADRARRQMYALLFGAVLIGAGYMLLVRRSILRPIRRLIFSAEEIKKGNLELAAPAPKASGIIPTSW